MPIFATAADDEDFGKLTGFNFLRSALENTHWSTGFWRNWLWGLAERQLGLRRRFVDCILGFKSGFENRRPTRLEIQWFGWEAWRLWCFFIGGVIV